MEVDATGEATSGEYPAFKQKGAIDLKSYGVGEYEVPVQITLPDGYTSLDTVKVKLKLVKAAEITTG